MHHLIFEGPELAGKSWIMSQVYSYLEPRFSQNKNLLDGCHWFNCDIGLFGSDLGKILIKNYLPILKMLKKRNVLLEKFHLADAVYNLLYQQKTIDYFEVEEELKKMDYKIIFVALPEDKNIITDRLKDRLKLYPHYKRIAKSAEWYLGQQKLYYQMLEKTNLPYLTIQTKNLPDASILPRILDWLGIEN